MRAPTEDTPSTKYFNDNYKAFSGLDPGSPAAVQAWAGAGYVVVTVNFPRTDCSAGTAADEADLVNQPTDMSYVLTRLLALNAQPHGWFSGLVNRDQVGVSGQSDGGDTVASLAANACCTDHRVRAVQRQHLQAEVRVLRQLEQPVQLPDHDRPAADSPQQDGFVNHSA